MIREAKLHDSKAIAEIIAKTWQSAYKGIIDKNYPENLDIQKFIQIITNNIQQQEEIIFVYEKNGIIKGFISGKILDDDNCQCEIVGFYVLPKYQQSGIGRLLFQRMKIFFSKHNCYKMILWTLKGAKNNSFYEKYGGTIDQEKILKIGNEEYIGVGYSFTLHPVAN